MFILNYPCSKVVLSPRNKYIVMKTYTNAKLKCFPFANNASSRNTLQTAETVNFLWPEQECSHIKGNLFHCKKAFFKKCVSIGSKKVVHNGKPHGKLGVEGKKQIIIL